MVAVLMVLAVSCVVQWQWRFFDVVD